jgi:hypothetical protein
MFSGTCDVLPFLKGLCESFGIGGSAILEADYCSNGENTPLPGYSTFFKVLILGYESSSGYSMYTFSSAESRWIALPKKCLRLKEPIFIHSEAVVCRGNVHWLGWDTLNFYTLEFSNDTGNICLIKLPIPRGQDELKHFDSPRLSVTTDGNLSFLRLHWKCLELEIWTCRGEKESVNGAEKWVHSKMIVLKPKKPHQVIGDGSAEWLHKPSCMCVGQRSGTLFITSDRELRYIVNLEDEAIEEVPSEYCNRIKKHNVVPFEMDWPAFFVSRLEPKQKK